MEAIMISIEPKWCALMMNGIKNIEDKKNKALASAIQKLIDKYGYAEIYVYCCKDEWLLYKNKTENKWDILKLIRGHKLLGSFNGKVIFKFRCYKVEEIKTCESHNPELLVQSCLNADEFYDYLTKGKNFLGRVLGYAIHISDLEIFDKPKKLSEFYKIGHYEDLDDYFTDEKQINGKWCIPLTKAPQNMCYVEVEELE